MESADPRMFQRHGVSISIPEETGSYRQLPSTAAEHDQAFGQPDGGDGQVSDIGFEHALVAGTIYQGKFTGRVYIGDNEGGRMCNQHPGP